MLNKKYPFGLEIATRVAKGALKNSSNPPSRVLSNLILLAKDDSFPSDLTQEYFERQSFVDDPASLKLIKLMIDEIRKPGVDIEVVLINEISKFWVKKKKVPSKKGISINPTKVSSLKIGKTKKTVPNKKSKNSVKNETIVVVVKKPKLNLPIDKENN